MGGDSEQGVRKKLKAGYLSKMGYLSADENDPAEMEEPQKQSSSIGYRRWALMYKWRVGTS